MNKPKVLYIMCGPAGSGKTTYITRTIIAEDNLYCAHVSRDLIRFTMLKDGDDYFKYEDLVYKKFISELQETLKSDIYDCVFADATHLTAKSRTKLLDDIFKDKEIDQSDVSIVPAFLDVDTKTCIERNASRTGRRKVPENVIIRMNDQKEFPKYDENEYVYQTILRIDTFGNELYFDRED